MTLVFNADSHRYRLDGKAVPSVTGLIGRGLPKEQLIKWSARTVAEYVADNRDAVESLWWMGRDPMVEALKKVPDSTRDAAANRGTEVHALAERVVHGDAVEVPGELAGYVKGYADFLDRFAVEPILTERSVAHRGLWYAGRFDLYAHMAGAVWLLDIKTARGVYGSTALQLAAYAGCDFYVDDDDPETEHPLPEAERFGVVHVTEYGTSLYPMRDAWDDWLAVLQVAKRRKDIEAHRLDEITELHELETA